MILLEKYTHEILYLKFYINDHTVHQDYIIVNCESWIVMCDKFVILIFIWN